MAKLDLHVSNKYLKIDKANRLVLIAACISTVIVVFALVVSQALLKQMSYQNKVIGLKSTAAKQLKTNVESTGDLKIAYDAFENTPESVLGTADKNSKIVLDSLPSKYDFPALATSFEGIVTASGNTLTGFTGTDNEVAAEQNNIDPKPLDIPFDLTAKGNFVAAQTLIKDMQRAIRPFQITSLTITGSDDNMQIKIIGKTFYQPEKKLDIEQKVVPGPSGARSTPAASAKAAQ